MKQNATISKLRGTTGTAHFSANESEMRTGPKMTKYVTVKLPDETKLRVARIAAHLHVDQADLTRRYIHQGLDADETAIAAGRPISYYIDPAKVSGIPFNEKHKKP